MKNGGARPGAGRKSKADELKLAESIDLALGETWVSDLLKKIHQAAKKGSFQHAQLLLAYKYGKPQENVNISTIPDIIIEHSVITVDQAKASKE